MIGILFRGIIAEITQEIDHVYFDSPPAVMVSQR